MIARPDQWQSEHACDRSAIQRLIRDELGESEIETVSEHLNQCPACRAILDDDSGHDRDWNECVPRVLTHLSSNESSDVSAEKSEPTQYSRSLISWLKPCDESQRESGYIGLLDRYLVRRVVGTGGMGVVFEGWDETLHRPIAIKAMHPHLAAIAVARQRFIREARAAAAIVHANVVPIHSVHAEFDPPYFVMPLIAGESLQSRMDRQGPLEVDAALRVASQVADGLAAAHVQGLVHRDIKPANILVEYGTERAMITDFGVVRALDEATMTVSGAIAGTPEYMSPEQARGDALDHRSDLFSLGSVLYAMLVGRSPFRAESPLSVLRRVCDDRPRGVRTHNPCIPGWLESMITYLHEKEACQRPNSATEVAEMLRHGLSHWNDPMRFPKPVTLNRNRFGRNAIIAASVAVALLVVFMFSGFYFLRDQRADSLDNGQNLSAVTTGTSQDESIDMTLNDRSSDLSVPRSPQNQPADVIEFDLSNEQSSEERLDLYWSLREIEEELEALEDSVFGPRPNY